MHANSLETAASKGGQTNGPPKTPHLNVGRSSLTNKARYDQDVVPAEQSTKSCHRDRIAKIQGEKEICD